MMHAATVFHTALTRRLNRPFGGDIAPGFAAEKLAREFSRGLRGLLDMLEEEMSDPHERDRPESFTIHHQLAVVWVKPGDDQHLKLATGFTRDQWLNMRVLWRFAGAPRAAEALGSAA